MQQLAAGGLFGYRMVFPAMRVGRHEVYWHRPLVACRSAESGDAVLLPGAPSGYITAYPFDKPRLDRPVELWPRLLDRSLHRAAIAQFAMSASTICSRPSTTSASCSTPVICSDGRSHRQPCAAVTHADQA